MTKQEQEQVKRKSKTKKVYKAANGATFGNDKAQIYGEALEDIRDKNGGVVTAKIIVQEAKDNSSPLHEVFEWNDTVAGEKFRLGQANRLLNHIDIKIEYEGTSKQTRAYLNVSMNDEVPNKVYVTVEKALSDKDMREQVIRKAIAEAKYWESKYESYEELENIFKQIEKTERKLIDDEL